RDRAYTVPELDALLASVGLRIVCWVEPVRYDPIAMLPEPKLRARLEAMSPTERAAVAEALAGNMAVHIVYCVRANDPVRSPDPMADAAVPVLREVDGQTLASGLRPDGTLPVMFDGLRLPIALPPLATAILPLVDGVRSVGEIRATLAGRGLKPDAIEKA